MSLKIKHIHFLLNWNKNTVHYNFGQIAFITALLFFTTTAFSQKTFDNYRINSPYSRIGVGDLVPEGSIRNFGMGGTGVSNSNGQFLNLINPALLINNRIYKYDSLTTILDGAVYGELRNLKDNSSHQLRGTANFFSFYYAFPLSKNWVTAVGLRPYSTVSYNIYVSSPIAGTTDSANVTYQGTGGINRAELANAYRLNKNLQLGFSASYLFGAVNNLSTSQIGGPTANLVGSNHKIDYRGFLLRPGLSYRKKISEHNGDSAVFLNVGLAYDWYTGLHGNEEFLVERRNYVNQVLSPPISVETTNRSLKFQSTYRTGVSIDNNIWNIALDFTYYNYNRYKGVNSRDSLKNGFTLALGGELALGKDDKEVSFENSLKVKYVRAGVSYTKSPIQISGKQLNEMSVSLGYSFPVGKLSFYRIYRLPRPQINLAVIAGQRGTFDNNLIKEQYIRGFLGFTINDKWFKRRRIE